jgi:ParB-like chromosome segregation protein Spo0J
LELPDFAKAAIASGDMTEGHARQVLALKNDVEAQKTLVDKIVSEGWSVRKAEQFVIAYKRGSGDKKQAATRAVRSENGFTRSFAKKIGLPVRQKVTGHGGEIIISYKTESELSQLQKTLDI